MKAFMAPIEMIAWFTRDGTPRPVKFRMLNSEESYIVIKVGRIVKQQEERLAGNRMIVFTCQSVIEGIEKLYEIKYELNSCRWYLYKI